MEVTKNIRKFIEAVFKSQRALASAMNISPQTLTPYMTGNSKPGWEIITKLWNVGCSIDWLITGEGDMFANNEAGEKHRAKFTVHKQVSKAITLSDAELLMKIPIINDMKNIIKEEIKNDLMQVIQ